MNEVPAIKIRFKNIRPNARTREEIRVRCELLGSHFPEAMRFEVELVGEGRGCAASARA